MSSFLSQGQSSYGWYWTLISHATNQFLLILFFFHWRTKKQKGKKIFIILLPWGKGHVMQNFTCTMEKLKEGLKYDSKYPIPNALKRGQ